MAKKIKSNEKRPLTLQNRNTVILNLGISALAAIFCMALLAISMQFNAAVSERVFAAEQYQAAVTNADAQRAAVKQLEEAVRTNGAYISSRLITQPEFVDFAGNVCQRNHLKLNKLTGGDAASQDGVMKITYQIEVQGLPPDLMNMITSLESLPSVYSVTSVSYRKAENYKWFTRGTDGEKVLEWWDMTDIPAPGAEPDKDNEAANEENVIDAAQMMELGEMVLYLNIDFVKVA